MEKESGCIHCRKVSNPELMRWVNEQKRGNFEFLVKFVSNPELMRWVNELANLPEVFLGLIVVSNPELMRWVNELREVLEIQMLRNRLKSRTHEMGQ